MVASLASTTLALLAVSNFLTPKYLLLYCSCNIITIDKETAQPIFLYVGIYELPLIVFDLCSNVQVLQKQSMHSSYVFIENAAKCDKKAVTAGSLEGPPCQIKQLITKNDTSSEINITTTQREFNSHIS